MGVTPGALAEQEGGVPPPPPEGPAFPLTTGSTRGPAVEFITSSVDPSSERLQLLSILNTGTSEPPSSVVGAGIPWVLESFRVLTIGPVCLSVWRAMGDAVAGPLTITYNDAQTDCAWSWVEVANIIDEGFSGAGAVIQKVGKVVESFTPTETSIEALLGIFASQQNYTFGAFLHNKPSSDPVNGSPELGYDELHEQLVPESALGYTASLLTSFLSNPDQSVRSDWTLAGNLIAIAIELGNVNSPTPIQANADTVVLARPQLQVGVSAWVSPTISEIIRLGGAVIGPRENSCVVDALVEEDVHWTVVPAPTRQVSWEEVPIAFP